MTRKFLLSSTGGGVHGMYGYHAEKRARRGGNRDRITLVTFAHHNVILQLRLGLPPDSTYEEVGCDRSPAGMRSSIGVSIPVPRFQVNRFW